MSTRPNRYRKYAAKDVSNALEYYLAHVTGPEKRSAKSVALQFKIPQRTFADYVKRYHQSGKVEPLRSGPEPFLGKAIEEDISTWILARSNNKLPVNRTELLSVANKIKLLLENDDNPNVDVANELLNPNPTVSLPNFDLNENDGFVSLGHNWTSRFLKRNPDLSPRQCENINRARAEVTLDSLTGFIDALRDVCHLHDIQTADQIFNMDETFVAPDQKRDVVIVLRGTKDVSQRVKSCSFHTTLVVCGSASGVVVPPMVLLPGVRRPKGLEINPEEILDVVLSPKGWMNSTTFVLFLQKFDNWIVAHQIQKPLILIVDNASSHSGIEALQFAKSHGIIIFFLPPNATHIAQPLDVAVFGPFKKTLNTTFRDVRLTVPGATISKTQMVDCILRTWKRANLKDNIRIGFQACGIWPIDPMCMQRRFEQFNQSSRNASLPHWIVVQMNARETLLTVPPPAEPAKKRQKKNSAESVAAIAQNDVSTQMTEDMDASIGECNLCVCELEFSDGDPCIRCDSCLKWFHGECVNIEIGLYSEETEFICVFCSNDAIAVESDWNGDE